MPGRLHYQSPLDDLSSNLYSAFARLAIPIQCLSYGAQVACCDACTITAIQLLST